jgi:hypothetical protein
MEDDHDIKIISLKHQKSERQKERQKSKIIKKHFQHSKIV